MFGQKLFLEKQFQTEETIGKYSESEALTKCITLAEEKINIKLEDKETIIDKKVLKKSLNDSTMDVEIFIVTNEIISE